MEWLRHLGVESASLVQRLWHHVAEVLCFLLFGERCRQQRQWHRCPLQLELPRLLPEVQRVRGEALLLQKAHPLWAQLCYHCTPSQRLPGLKQCGLRVLVIAAL